MEFFAFLFIEGLSLAFFSLLAHYRDLLQEKRESYLREELINWRSILEKKLKDLLLKDTAYLYFLLGGFLAFLSSFMGGLYGRYYEDYFFNSSFLGILLFFLLPYLKEEAQIKEEATFLSSFIKYEAPFFLGFSITLFARIWSVYFYYHAISIWWVLLHGALLGFFILKKYPK